MTHPDDYRLLCHTHTPTCINSHGRPLERPSCQDASFLSARGGDVNVGAVDLPRTTNGRSGPEPPPPPPIYQRFFLPHALISRFGFKLRKSAPLRYRPSFFFFLSQVRFTGCTLPISRPLSSPPPNPIVDAVPALSVRIGTLDIRHRTPDAWIRRASQDAVHTPATNTHSHVVPNPRTPGSRPVAHMGLARPPSRQCTLCSTQQTRCWE